MKRFFLLIDKHLIDLANRLVPKVISEQFRYEFSELFTCWSCLSRSLFCCLDCDVNRWLSSV